MEVKPGYKLTDSGVLPDDWEVTKIGVAGQVLGGRQRSPHNTGELCKYLRVANVFDGYVDTSDVLEMPFTTKEKERFLLRDGDILLNEGQSLELVGRSAIYRGEPGDCCFQNTLVRFRANAGTVPEFAQVVFQRYLTTGVFASIASQTTSIAHLGSGRFANLPFPRPPLPEQRAIAAALGDVDALLASLDQSIVKKRDLKQAAMQQLLTGQTRLPGFSAEWVVKRFGELFDFLKTANNARSDLTEYGDVGYIHYGDIHTYPSAFWDCSRNPLPHIEQKKVKGFPHVEDGDLVMADASEDYTGIGKCIEVKNVNDRKIVAGLHTFLLRGDKELLAHGFKGYLQFLPAVRSALVRLATGISVYGISKGSVRSIEVKIPKTDEQSAIAEVLSDMDAEIGVLEDRRNKTRLLKEGMTQELLTGRTRLV